MIAEILGVPALTYATKVAVEGDRVTIHRQTASGYDVVVSPIPVVVSVTSGAVEPRYPTFKGIMEAKKKPLTTITAAELGVDITIGQEMVSAEAAPERSGGRKIEDDGEAHREIVKLLEQVKVI
jgi:electron transfer flavoprotein beta subunit